MSNALDYHRLPIPGKIGMRLTKPLENQHDLGLAYTPGVAEVSRAIVDNPEDVYTYTNRGNSVAVISDGTAVLGLGNIGPAAAIPVMEGKAALFKAFAGIDAYPICVPRMPVEQMIEFIHALAGNYGGINLEDIKAPECFEIEAELAKLCDIPVFHDDQHGAAIIVLAALKNSLEVVGKNVQSISVVINGAGAAALATAKLLVSAGLSKEQLTILDRNGVIYYGRKEGLNKYKNEFLQRTKARTLDDAVKGADVFIGFSVGGVLTPPMVSSMAKDPIVFALANPVPEIYPDEAKKAGARVVATGRSDYPNQLNNVLGFPGIFRGALNVRAKQITPTMKMAAADALVNLAKSAIPEDIAHQLAQQYPEEAERGVFDKLEGVSDALILPKPFDPRVVPAVAEAVSEAAMKDR